MSFIASGAVIVAGAGLASAAIGAGAASSAADKQAAAAQNAQNISQNEFNTITAQNAPYMQSGYGALSALDWGLGISPQTATGGSPYASSGTPNGIDPSTGYAIGPGGSISQMIPGGSGMSPTYTGNHGPYGSIGANGISLGQTVQPQVTGSGQLGGSGIPVSGAPAAGAPAGGQTGGLGFGSLTTPFTTQNWQQLSPAYNFQLRQGQQGVQNADAAGQGAMSGAALKDLTDYNQSAANQSFNSAFNQYQTQQGNIFSRLSGIAGLGQSSANNTGQQGTTLAGQAAQSALAGGAYQAAGTVGVANAISGGLSNAAPWIAYGGGGGGSNSNPAAWDTENPANFQDFQSSDRRLKTDIHIVGKLDSGLNVYTFRYTASPAAVHMGVMADEVQKVIPEAVSIDDAGYLQVSYRMLR